MSDVVEVGVKPHLFLVWPCIGNEVNEVGAVTRNIEFTRVNFTCCGAGACSHLVEVWAKLAFWIGAQPFGPVWSEICAG